MKTFSSVAEIKRANEAAGKFWFSASTVAFFNSRMGSEVVAGVFFVSTEQGPHDDDPRRATIRIVEDDGASIETVGEFQAYDHASEAFEALRAALREGVRAVSHEDHGNTFWKVMVGDLVIGVPWKSEERAREEVAALVEVGVKAASTT